MKAAAAVTFLEEEEGERSGFPPSPTTDLKKGWEYLPCLRALCVRAVLLVFHTTMIQMIKMLFLKPILSLWSISLVANKHRSNCRVSHVALQDTEQAIQEGLTGLSSC